MRNRSSDGRPSQPGQRLPPLSFAQSGAISFSFCDRLTEPISATLRAMPLYIEMPKLSDTMTEGTLLRWKIQPGQTVKAGQIVAEVETDKATMEMEAFDDGVVHELLVKEGDRVPLGAQMASLLEDGEAAPAAGAAAPESKPAEKPADPSPATPAPAAPAAVAPPPAPAPDAAASGRVKASPLARKIAAERGVSLSGLAGSGPGGRIVSKDVPAAGSAPAKATPSAAAPAQPAPAPIRPTAAAGDTRTPLSTMRSIIASRLLASKTQIPHFYLNIEVDAGPLMKLRQQVNEASEKQGGGNKYTVNDFILRAVAAAVSQEPRVNASFDGDAIVQFASVHLCVAIAVEDGLVTPVIRDAQKKSLLELSTAVKDLAARAKAKKLKPDEFTGGTLTVSNLGAYGIDSFDAIINPPQAAILSIGAIVKKPVVDAHGNIVPGERLCIGMSCDHRVVDGAVGASYLAALRKLIENPALMFL